MLPYHKTRIVAEGLAGHLAILVTGPSNENPDANSKMALLGLEAP